MTSIFQAGQPFNVVRTSSTTYQANDKDLVISSGDEVALPSPNQGATILVRPAPSINSVKITTSNGTIGNTGETFGTYRATEPIYLVGDGTDWYARSGGDEISAIPGSVIDNFESDSGDPAGPYASGEDLSTYYRGYLSGFSRTSSSPIEGNYSLQTSAGNGFAIFSEPGDGLPQYPQDNDTLDVLVYNSGALPVIFFNVTYDDANDNINGYGCRYWANNQIDLKRYDNSTASDTNTNRSSLASKSISKLTDTAYWLEISTADSNGNISATLYDVDSSLNRGSQIESVSATDTTHDYRGIGFGTSLDGTGLIADRLRIA